MDPKETLLYWIKERYEVFLRRKDGIEKPWSEDPVFQRTYFCNVHRENDRVTKWIREYYSPHVNDPLFEYNIVLSRFLNWPPTLEKVGYLRAHLPEILNKTLRSLAEKGKIWGGAYVITTHGIPMAKVDYLTNRVLEQASKALEAQIGYGTCAGIGAYLQGIEGIGSFLAGQIVADLKNTPGHALYTAPDKATFVVPGPGSMRGVSWFLYGHPDRGSETTFRLGFKDVRKYVDEHWPEDVPPVDNQDLQNCLCEYDKYMRVKNGTGRSKRSFNGY